MNGRGYDRNGSGRRYGARVVVTLWLSSRVPNALFMLPVPARLRHVASYVGTTSAYGGRQGSSEYHALCATRRLYLPKRFCSANLLHVFGFIRVVLRVQGVARYGYRHVSSIMASSGAVWQYYGLQQVNNRSGGGCHQSGYGVFRGGIRLVGRLLDNGQVVHQGLPRCVLYAVGFYSLVQYGGGGDGRVSSRGRRGRLGGEASLFPLYF